MSDSPTREVRGIKAKRPTARPEASQCRIEVADPTCKVSRADVSGRRRPLSLVDDEGHLEYVSVIHKASKTAYDPTTDANFDPDLHSHSISNAVSGTILESPRT